MKTKPKVSKYEGKKANTKHIDDIADSVVFCSEVSDLLVDLLVHLKVKEQKLRSKSKAA